MPPQFLEHIVILCFERQYTKQNSVIRLKSNILVPKFFWVIPKFWAGYGTDYIASLPDTCFVLCQ